MQPSDFTINSPIKTSTESGTFGYQSPSNIALVKYWGKHGDQLPQNPSISFTLSNCHTKTTLTFKKAANPSEEVTFDIFLDGEAVPDFKPKIIDYFERILPYAPYLLAYEFKIETTNSFPHSSGIASSASGMSALSLCIMELERTLYPDMTADYFTKKASFLSRLGSGSASRSIEGPLVVWGKHQAVNASTDLIGVPYNGPIHDNFKNFQDTILLVDKGEKQVSSTIGHGLMHKHPYATARFEQAHENLAALLDVIAKGDLDGFIKIVESEALTLHAMMMTSQPYFILMKPNTLKIINAIWVYREKTASKACFTLDAGANVHLLYPESEKEEVQSFIESQLSKYCQNSQYINDFAGDGAKKM